MKKSAVVSPKSTLTPLWMTLLGAILLIILTWVVYSPALENSFTNYDERAYVNENPGLKELSTASVSKEFKSFYMGNYHPLTMLSYALDYQVHKLDPKGYILTNILLHILASLFVFIFIYQITRQVWSALAGSLLFSLHPLHVESVAWIAERKDVLYTAFLSIALVTAWTWISQKSKTAWVLTLLFFLLACLSKGMAVVFSPVLLLLMITHKILQTKQLDLTKQWKEFLRPELIPFFMLSLIFGYIAIIAQSEAEAIRTDTAALPFYAKILYPAYGAWFYLQKFLLPIPLSAHYDYPTLKNPVLWIAPVLIGGIIFGLWKFKQRIPEWTLAFGFYLVSISIVLQILPVGKAIAADRYFYFASIGFSVALAWTLNKLNKPILTGLMCIALMGIGLGLTQPRIKVWKNSLSLWEDTYKENPRVPFVLFNLGVSLEKSGKESDQRAMDLYRQAIQIDPTYFEPYNNLGILLNTYGKPGDALPLYYKALELKPGHSDSYNNLATALQALGKYEDALDIFRSSLKSDPRNPSPHNNLGTLLNELKRYNEAAYHYNQALTLNPKEPRIWYNLGNLYYQIQKPDSAEYCYLKALEIKPNYPDAMGNMGVLFFSKQDYKTALSWYEKALIVDPNFRDAYFNMGVTWYYLNDRKKSRENFGKAAALGHAGAQQWIQNNP